MRETVGNYIGSKLSSFSSSESLAAPNVGSFCGTDTQQPPLMTPTPLIMNYLHTPPQSWVYCDRHSHSHLPSDFQTRGRVRCRELAPSLWHLLPVSCRYSQQSWLLPRHPPDRLDWRRGGEDEDERGERETRERERDNSHLSDSIESKASQS